jgi:ABC-type branched-subunit amino acid transport system ATPase component
MSILVVENIFSGYEKNEVLHGVDLKLEKDEVITIIGPNGSGKSTLLKTIMGYLIPFRGRVFFNKEDVTKLGTYERVIKGIGYVPQLDNVFTSLTVEENLEMGGYNIRTKKDIKSAVERIFEIFPNLKKRKRQKAETMSGGERQMLAMGRALISKPKVLLLDEPSAGVAPNVSFSIFEKIKEIQQTTGTATIIVEQEAHSALAISHKGYVLVNGQNEFEDDATKILSDKKIKKAFLGG